MRRAGCTVVAACALLAAWLGHADASGVVVFTTPAVSVAEGQTATLMLSRSGGAGNASVRWTTSDGTAVAGADYPFATGIVTFDANQMTQKIMIPTSVDAAIEGDESFRVTLSDPIGLTLGTPASATVTILDGQQGIAFAAAEYTVSEAAATATITVVRTGPTTGAVSARYSTSPGSAVAGRDYTAVDGIVTFPSGARTATFRVPILGDTLSEAGETVLLTLSEPTPPAGLGRQRAATLRILDDDAPGAVRLGGAAFTVGEGAGTMMIPVQRTGPAAGITVDYATMPGIATAGVDYLVTRGTLTFAAGEMLKTFPVTILNDTRDELNETFTVVLSNVSPPASLGTPASAVVTITDDDAGGAIAFSAASYMVAEGVPFAVVTVNRTGGAAGGATVDFASADGTATAGADYTGRTLTLTFQPGELSKQVTIPIAADFVREGNETVLLTLSNPGGGATLGTPRAAALTIVDKETGPTVQFASATFVAPESAPSAMITLTRTGSMVAGQTVTLRTTTAGTAPPGQFTAIVNQVVQFPANQPSVTVPLALSADNAIIDGDRTVVLELVTASPPLSLGAPRTAVLTIRDDDSVFRFTSPSYRVVEGAPATLTVERFGATLTQATVRFTTADGTAVAPGDYTATTAGTLTFAPGIVSRTITIPTVADMLVEGNETFTVTLSQPTGATLGDPSQAVVTITDNDFAGTVQFSATAYSVLEGGTAMITVTRTGGLGGPLTVDFATVPGGTATGGATAGPGIDYITRTVTLTFAPGVTTQTVSVATVPDTVFEGPETVRLALTVPPGSAAVLGTPALAELTIVDDEQVRFQFSASSFSVLEGGKAMLTVQRVGPATGSHSVGYAVAGLTATAGQDFDATGGTLLFGPGVTTQTISIQSLPDQLNEAGETFLVSLVNPVAPAGLGTPSVATVTIADDDAPGKVQFTVASAAVAEGDALTLTVVRTGAPGPATVQWSTSNGTATAGQDYVAAGGTLTFAAGETSKTLPPLVTLADSAVEGAEFFEVTLSAPTNFDLGTPAKATVWIVDAQQSVQFSESAVSVVEGGAMMATLLRVGLPAGELRAKLAVGGSAIPDVDYASLGNPVEVVFPPGVASQTVAVRALNNLTVEPVPRVLRLQIVEVTGGTAGAPGAVDITFADNDAPDLVVTSLTVPAQSTNGFKTPVTATVRNRTGAAAGASKLGVFLSPGSAVPGAGTRIGLLDTPPLAGGVIGTVSGTVTVPPDLAQGVYFVSVVADVLNAVAESVESNNGLTAATTLEIVPSLPDLVVTSVGIPGETLTGKTVSTPTTVINAGLVASPPYRVGLFLAKDDPTPGAGTLMAMKDMPALGPGASAAVPLSVAIPEDQSQGQYFISAVADVNRAIVDADRSNNALVSDVPFRVNRSLGGFKTASATLSIAPAVTSPAIAAPFLTAATTSCIVNQISASAVTLNLSGSLTVTGQTSNTGQGTTVLKGNIVNTSGVIVGTGTLTGTFRANIDDSDIATVSVDFTLAVVPAGAVSAPPPATGRFTTSGRVALGEIQTTLTSGMIDGCGPLSGTVTFRGTQSFFFSLLFFADGGAFAGRTTPIPSYPLTIDVYSAGVVVLFDTTPAVPKDVLFTGPPGSGMTNVPAEIQQSFAAGKFYETDTLLLPATSLKGTWFVNYEGATKSFTVAEPQAAQRFVAMLPTVTLDSQLRITKIDWVFKDRLTGATVPAPLNADALQVELDGLGLHPYTSPNFTRTVTTTGPISPPIPVSQVTHLYISYKDTLSGNFYVTSYTRD